MKLKHTQATPSFSMKTNSTSSAPFAFFLKRTKMELTVEGLSSRAGVKDLDQECTEDDFTSLADFCDPWEEVGNYLQLKDHQLSSIAEDKKTAVLRRMEMLRVWKQSNAHEATFRVLVEALFACGKVDKARKVCEYLAKKEGILNFETFQWIYITLDSIYTSMYASVFLPRNFSC